MATPRTTQREGGTSAGGTGATERRTLASRLAEASRRAEGFRGAYEALIEPLINATIKVAAAESEGQQLAALEAQLAALEAQRATTQAERDLLAKELQAVYRSHSWRVTAPLRYVITGVRRLRPCVSLYFSRAANGALAFAAMHEQHLSDLRTFSPWRSIRNS